MSYLAYHFKVSPVQPGAEILTAFISEMPFESFESTDEGLVAYIQEDQAKDLSFDFELEDIQFTYDIKAIETTNWNAEWEKNFEPVVIENLLCIRAPFHEKNLNVNDEIIIMPKMSFGTGHHQTTRLVCKCMYELDLKNKEVMDVGCGTGILSILAKKLGAQKVLGFDIDEWSVTNSIENCKNNGLGEIELFLGGIDMVDSSKLFDVVLANINKNILKKQMQSYANNLKLNGCLLISGFFVTDVEELTFVANQHQLKLILFESENEWGMMKLQKIQK